MEENDVYKQGVTKLLKGLNPSEASGHKNFILESKELTIELDPVFAHFFQQSIVSGEKAPGHRGLEKLMG